MAQLTLYRHFDSLFMPSFLGQFEPSHVTNRDETLFKLKFPSNYGDNAQLRGFTVSYKGTGFDYQTNDGVSEPVDGTISSVEVRDKSNALVLKITGLSVSIADIYTLIVHTDGAPGPDYQGVLEHLLQGADTITGSDEDDNIQWQENWGNDVINAKGGNDWIGGSAGDDTIDGGDGFDTLQYRDTDWGHSSFHGIKVTMTGDSAGKVIDPWGDEDNFSNIEMIQGSRFADTYIGKAGDTTSFEFFVGLRGADTIKVEVGNNFWTTYVNDREAGGKRGINADLGGVADTGSGDVKGTIRDGFGTVDKVTNVHHVEGTMSNDTMVGSSLNDNFNGLAGVDSFDGRGGKDIVYFDSSYKQGGTVGIVVDWTKASGQIENDGFGNTETMSSIEGVVGTMFGDKITGNGGNQLIVGAGGKDTMTGGDGNDRFLYGFPDHFKPEWGDSIKDFTSGEDKLVFNRANIANLDSTLRFHQGDGATSTQASGKSEFYFDTASHKFYFDEDGVGGSNAVLVATLSGVNSLANGDISIINRPMFDDII
jgi:Ca2+-binding RTX toxin-like protein